MHTYISLGGMEAIHIDWHNGVPALGKGRISADQGLHLDHAEFFGVLAILTAAIMHALCYVITKQKGSAISVITYNTLPIGIAGLMLFVAGLWFETPTFETITLRSWSALFYLGLVASVGGKMMNTNDRMIGLKRLSSMKYTINPPTDATSPR